MCIFFFFFLFLVKGVHPLVLHIHFYLYDRDNKNSKEKTLLVWTCNMLVWYLTCNDVKMYNTIIYNCFRFKKSFELFHSHWWTSSRFYHSLVWQATEVLIGYKLMPTSCCVIPCIQVISFLNIFLVLKYTTLLSRRH